MCCLGGMQDPLSELIKLNTEMVCPFPRNVLQSLYAKQLQKYSFD